MSLSKETILALQNLEVLAVQLQGAARLFTATPSASRSVDSIKECALFLGEVVALGAPQESLGVLEEAYWDLLDSKPSAGGWETKPLFNKDVRTVDRESVEAVSRQVMQDNKAGRDAVDELYNLVGSAEKAAYADGIEEGERAGFSKSVAIGPLLRAAIFITLAIKSGVTADNHQALRALVVARALPLDVKIFSAGIEAAEEDAEVRRQLGISLEEWIASEKVDTFSAGCPSRLGAHEERMRKQLGMTQEEWMAGEKVETFSAARPSSGESVDEKVRVQLGISREVWDRHN